MKDKAIIYSVCLMIFIDALGTGIILPIIPYLFFDVHLGLLSEHNYAKAAIFYSLALAFYPLMGVFGMPFFGAMSDRYGRKPLLLIGGFLFTINYLLSAIAIELHNVYLFLFGRICGGFLSGIYSVGNAIIADFGSNENDTFNKLKLPSLADKLGLVFGPILSIFVVRNTYITNELTIPYLCATLLGILNLSMLWYNFRNVIVTKNTSNKEESTLNKIFNTINPVYQVFYQKKLRGLIISFLFFQISAGFLLQTLPIYDDALFLYAI